ncbi:MAG: phospho-N-acetylmuramoyl-pentapeptide-transferase [Candidatus Omnitrophota bacterium]
MLYHLLYSFRDLFFGFNVFRYITVRAGLGAVTAFLFCVIFGPWFIRKLRAGKIGEEAFKPHCGRIYAAQKEKQGKPTMGGVLIIAAIVFAVVLWGDLGSPYILLALLSLLWLGLVGFRDDYLKWSGIAPGGLRAKDKLLWQGLLALVIAGLLFWGGDFSTIVDVPFLKNLAWDIGAFYVLLIILVVVASSNAVNITDGLDGLAIGSVTMVALFYCLLSYVSGHYAFSKYLLIPHIPLAGELTVFCAAVFGASLGFLWFNCYPAEIFMGDTGSLALGGALGTIAVLIKKELLLGIVGMVFVFEAFSVIMQVVGFKLTGRRIFDMAPLHHHFQIRGWNENKIIVRFWIVGIIFIICTLMTLKLR